ncbi:MAG: hypothetical protein ABSB19_12385 [Methylomonas sp.]|jgi:hypothetical protein
MNRKITYHYYSWEGDPCRIHIDADGNWIKADLYRGGIGLIEVYASDVWWGSKPIGKHEYQLLVLEEIALHKEQMAREQTKHGIT